VAVLGGGRQLAAGGSAGVLFLGTFTEEFQTTFRTARLQFPVMWGVLKVAGIIVVVFMAIFTIIDFIMHKKD
jgi:hypothetical protein